MNACKVCLREADLETQARRYQISPSMWSECGLSVYRIMRRMIAVLNGEEVYHISVSHREISLRVSDADCEGDQGGGTDQTLEPSPFGPCIICRLETELPVWHIPYHVGSSSPGWTSWYRFLLVVTYAGRVLVRSGA